MKSKDFDNLIYKDSQRKGRIKKVVYSRIIFVFFLILIQLIIFFLFCLKLYRYIDIYLGVSLTLSFLFMIYLANCKGKSEYKLAWILLLIVFPVLGIAAYILYHTNTGGLRLQRRIKYVKKQTYDIHPDDEECSRLLEKYDNVKDLFEYLHMQGHFYASENNRIKYYPSGEVFFPELLEELKKAEQFIFIEFFIIGLDESWKRVLDILEEKVAQGVEVRVLYDSIGSITLATRAYQQYLREKGIKSHIFLKMIPLFTTKLNNRDHRKIVVIDGKVGFTGGLNLSNEYFNYGKNRFDYWKDNAIKIEGSAIHDLTKMFMENWNLETKTEDNYSKYIDCDYEKYNQKGLVAVYGDDAYNNEDIAENVYTYILTNAKKYVYITSPYVVIDNHMVETIVFAVKRGIDVRLIVPSKPDHLITYCIGKTYIKNLMDAGVKIYLYDKGFIHAKTFLSDDKTATIGSINLDYRSFYLHFECGALIYKNPVISDIKNDFEETLKDCTLMTKELYKKIPIFYRMLGYIFRIIGPLV